jgi:hypothetical protein
MKTKNYPSSMIHQLYSIFNKIKCNTYISILILRM